MCGQQLMSVSVVLTIVMTTHGDLLTVKCYLFKFDSTVLNYFFPYESDIKERRSEGDGNTFGIRRFCLLLSS